MQLTVLILFFLIVSVIIPSYFYWYFFKEERDIGGIDIKNKENFNNLIDENMLTKNLPGIFG